MTEYLDHRDILEEHRARQTHEAITAAREWLRDNAERYEAACAKLSDPVFVLARLEAVGRHRLLLEAFSAGDAPSKAVFLLARADAFIKQELEELLLVRRYENQRAAVDQVTHRTTEGATGSA